MTHARTTRVLAAVALALGLCAALLACGAGEDTASRLAKAAEHVRAGETEEALIELRAALKADPKNAEVNFQIAKLLHRQEQIPDAVFFYEEAIRLDPKHEDARLILAFLMLGDDVDYAQRLVDEVIARNPKNALAWVRRSDIALARSDSDAALSAALTAAEVAPDDARTQIQLGLVHRARIRKLELLGEPVPDALFADALAAFERAGKGKDDSPDHQTVVSAWVERGNLLASWEARRAEAPAAYQEAFAFAQKVGGSQDLALQAAIEHAQRTRNRELRRWALEQRIALHPAHLRSWHQLAALVDPPEAERSTVLEKLIATRPADARAHAAYARDLVARKQLDAALAHLDAVAPTVSAPEVALLAKLEIALDAHREDVARAAAARLAKDYGGSLESHMGSSLILRRELRFKEAADEIQSAMDGFGETPRLLGSLAELRLLQGDTDAALGAAERGLSANANGLEQLSLLRVQARAQLRRGANEAALTTFQKMGKITGGRVATPDLVPFAQALYATQRDAQGRQLLDIALGLPEPPVDAIVLFARREGERDAKRAEELLGAAIAKQPENPTLLEEAARFDLAAGRIEQAKSRLDAAIAAMPEYAPLHLMLGRVLWAKGDYAGTIRSVEEAMRLAPDSPSPVAATLLVNAYGKLGRVDDAIAKLESEHAAHKLGIGGQVLLGRLLTAKGVNDRAIALLEQITAAAPTLAGPKNDLAYLLVLEKRDLDRALSLAQEARAALPNVGSVADTLGFAYLAKNLPQAALPQFDEAIGLADASSPEWATAQFHRALALRALGRADDSRAAAEASLSVASFPEQGAAKTLLEELNASAKQG